MAITPVGSAVFGQASAGTAEVDVPTGAGTDLEVALGGSNFFDVDDGFGPPSGGGWTLRHTVDRGVNDAHVRCWTRTAPAGAHSVTLAPIDGEEVWLAIRRLAGADLANPVDDVDGATSANGNHTAPALSLTTQAWLFGCAQTETFASGGGYTPPAGFSELADTDLIADSARVTVAEDQAAGPGSVGPFTFVYSLGNAGCALVVGIRDATPAEPEPAEVTAEIPLTLAVAAETAADHAVTADVPLALAIGGQAAAVHAVTADLPLSVALGATAAAEHAVAAAIPLALTVDAVAATEHRVTASLPLALAVDPVTDAPGVPDPAHVTTSIPLTLAVAPAAAVAHRVTAEFPLTIALGANADNGTMPDLAPSAARTYVVPPELRVLAVAAEPLAYAVAADRRTLAVAESRTYAVPAEGRTVRVE